MKRYNFPDVFLVTKQKQEKQIHVNMVDKSHFSNDLKLLLVKLRILSFVNQLSTLSQRKR